MENDRKNQTTRTKKRKKMLTGVLFVTGLLLCIYPAFASVIDRKHQQNVIQTYQGNIEANSEEKLQEMLGEAERYNGMLWQTNGVLIGYPRARERMSTLFACRISSSVNL